MKSRISLHYDNEGDVLEVILGKPTKGHMKNLGKGIFERIDEKNGKTKGFLIISSYTPQLCCDWENGYK